MRAAIYARVSTNQQSTDMQLTELRAYVARMPGWSAVEYLEVESSMKKRPVFDRMLADARARRIDIVLVWAIDRFARSGKQFVSTVLELDAAGVALRSVTQNISSEQRDPMGQFVLFLFGLLAELERGIIVARVNAGIAEAKKKGKHCGRPAKIFRRDLAVEMRARGMSWRVIEKELGVPQSTLRAALAPRTPGTAPAAIPVTPAAEC